MFHCRESDAAVGKSGAWDRSEAGRSGVNVSVVEQPALGGEWLGGGWQTTLREGEEKERHLIALMLQLR